MTLRLGSGLRARLDKNMAEFNLSVHLSNGQSATFNFSPNFPPIRYYHIPLDNRITDISVSSMCILSGKYRISGNFRDYKFRVNILHLVSSLFTRVLTFD